MIPIELLSLFILASTLLALSPGPDNFFVLVQSALYGKGAGVMITLGLCTGLVVHTSLVALGLAAIVQESSTIFWILKIFGAGYLLYIAYQLYRAPVSALHMSSKGVLSWGALYRRGVIMNISNPKVTFFFLAFLPQFASPDEGNFVMQIFMLGGIFMLVAFGVFSFIAVSADKLGKWLIITPQAQGFLNRLASVVLSLLAVMLFIG